MTAQVLNTILKILAVAAACLGLWHYLTFTTPRQIDYADPVRDKSENRVVKKMTTQIGADFKKFESEAEIRSFEAEWPDDRGGCLLVREGALIPFGPLMQYRGERPLDEMELYVFPSAQPTEFELYEDDGVTFDYLQGKYSLTKITQRKEADGTVIITIGDTPAGMVRHWSVTAALDHAPAKVENNGTRLPADQLSWDAARKELRIDAVRPGTVKIF